MIFETHAHYDDEKFDEDRAELLSSMQENGIGRIINVSANLESLENTRKLMEAYPFIYGAFGLHPDEVGDLNEDVMARMLELCLCHEIFSYIFCLYNCSLYNSQCLKLYTRNIFNT